MSISVALPSPFYSSDGNVLRNDLPNVRFDRHPVTPGHCLIILFRSAADFFSTTEEERQAMPAPADSAMQMPSRDFAPHAFNLGIKFGEVADQTVAHVHLHLIHRYPGDIENPLGGVRGWIPAWQIY